MSQWKSRREIPQDNERSTNTGSGFIIRGCRNSSNFAEIPMWPVVTGLAVAFIWTVNTLSPGTLSFITGYSFIDSVMLGVIISALYILYTLRARERESIAEEIMENIAREKEAAKAEAAAPYEKVFEQDRAMNHYQSSGT